MKASLLTVKTIKAIVNEEGEIVGEFSFSGKNVRVGTYYSGSTYIERHDGTTILELASEGGKYVLTVPQMAEVANVVDRLLNVTTAPQTPEQKAGLVP
jgi:hypothetical protein